MNKNPSEIGNIITTNQQNNNEPFCGITFWDHISLMLYLSTIFQCFLTIHISSFCSKYSFVSFDSFKVNCGLHVNWNCCHTALIRRFITIPSNILWKSGRITQNRKSEKKINSMVCTIDENHKNQPEMGIVVSWQTIDSNFHIQFFLLFYTIVCIYRAKPNGCWNSSIKKISNNDNNFSNRWNPQNIRTLVYQQMKK